MNTQIGPDADPEVAALPEQANRIAFQSA